MIIITGASQGIGRFLFTKFKSEFDDTIGLYNSSITQIKKDIASYYKVDISDFKQVNDWADSIKNNLTNIIVINCAGISYTSFAHKSDIEMWKKTIDINLTGTFHVIRCLLPIMREQRYGRIICFSSVVTKRPTLGVSAYAASKAGLIGMTKTIAAENAAYGITANSINLGYADLGMGVNAVSKEYQELVKQKNPMKRFCNPEEIYNVIKFLINTEYVNGANIDIDGGV